MQRERLTRHEVADGREEAAPASTPSLWGRAQPTFPEGRAGVDLALQLQRSSGNNAVVRALARDRGTPASGSQAPTADAGAPADAGPETPELRARLDEIERNYRSIVADGRGHGYNVAADNLERFLAGTGGVKNENVTWLRGFAEITAAERTNQGRFESSLNDQANQMHHGDRRTFTDHWDRMLTGSGELYYASGTSTIRSTGNFSLEMIENEVSISGTVTHHWFDPYDWHAGLSAFVPGHGSVSDADALLLQRYRGARQFDMQADWTQTLSGHISVGHVWNTKSFSWSGP